MGAILQTEAKQEFIDKLEQSNVENSLCHNILSEFKSLKSHLGESSKDQLPLVKKKFSRLNKWLKMIKLSSVTTNNKLHRAKLIQDIQQGNRSLFSSPESKRSYSKYEVRNKHDATFLSNSSYTLLNYYETGLLNDKLIEEGLRQYYHTNRDHFIERVSKGPPESLRLLSWIIIKDIPVDRTNGMYEFYTNLRTDEEIDRLIKRDLGRTYPNSEIRLQLYNLLKAFANNDMTISYCQGMNFIVGFLLTLTEFNNENDIFFLLLALFSDTFSLSTRDMKDYSIRGLFMEEFPLLKLFLFQFEALMEKKIPDLKKHLDLLCLPNEAWVSNWFQTLFTIFLPVEYCKRVWDCILCYGIPFMFNFIIAFLREIKKDLLEIDEAIGILDYLKKLQGRPLNKTNTAMSTKIDIEKIIWSAKRVEVNPHYLMYLKEEYERKNSLNIEIVNIKKYNIYDCEEGTSSLMFQRTKSGNSKNDLTVIREVSDLDKQNEVEIFTDYDYDLEEDMAPSKILKRRRQHNNIKTVP